MKIEEFNKYRIAAQLTILLKEFWLKNIKDIYSIPNSYLALKYIKSEIADLEEVNNKFLMLLNNETQELRDDIIDIFNKKIKCINNEKNNQREFEKDYNIYLNYREAEKENERQEEERINNFFKKHDNFKSIFNDCYEDKDLDNDIQALESYLEKNNMLSSSLAICSHDRVVIRAKLAVARNKARIQNLVIPKEENKYKTDKDYSRYEIIGVKPAYVKSNLSKRKLPTEIFTYLISNNILTSKNFNKYSINQFGRTFETKMGDIILDNELPESLDRQKRYNKVDFSQYPKSDFQGTLYISNQWDKNSIDKLINDIETNYGKHLSIITPEVANVVAYAYDEEISQIEKDYSNIKKIER